MGFVVGIGSLGLIAAILLDAFEAVLLPRRVTHGYRFIRFYYRNTWRAWRQMVKLVSSPRRRETLLSLFGPLALLVLICIWASVLVIAFGLLHWALRTPFATHGAFSSPEMYLYFSGTTFFTLGYGDLTPIETWGRFLAVVESGLGFGFLAMIIGYHPVITQAFSRREIVISLLDARGGSPPTAAQILVRQRGSQSPQAMISDMAVWEVWSAELLESSLSFPMLAYYRSQHDNQSWLAALTAILDTCALTISGVGPPCRHQALLTFAIARHAAVDLTLVFKITPAPPDNDRLGAASLEKLKELFNDAGIPVADWATMETKLAELRAMYEPFVNALASYFLLNPAEFVASQPKADNWQTSAWMPRTPGILNLPDSQRGDHFE